MSLDEAAEPTVEVRRLSRRALLGGGAAVGVAGAASAVGIASKEVGADTVL